MKVYISGKITGLPFNEAFKKFEQAEKDIKSRYECDVINPMKEVTVLDWKSWESYMIEDIRLLNQCDTIYMIDNWKDSKGANIELLIAKAMKINIIFKSK